MNKQITFLAFVFLALFMISSVSAIVAVVSPANNTNQTGTVTFNATLVNGTDIGATSFTQAGINVSFYTVVNGTPTLAITVACSDVDGINLTCSGTMTITSANDGMYNVTAMVLNSTGSTNSSVTNSSNVRFDTTAPTISFQGTTPSAGSYLNQTSIAVNVSSVDSGVGLNMIRVYLYNNTWGLVNNTNTTSNGRLLNFTSLTVEGAYYINVTANDTINNVNDTQVSRTITLDTTSPSVSSSDIASPLNYGNYSYHTDLVVLNVSVTDAITSISNVFFNITNGSGYQNATIGAVQQGSSSYYNATLNTSEYPDGFYNVTVYVNDSAGNVNNSAVVLNMRVDNTDPVITFTCDRTTLRTGEVITCSCSATDAVSGVSNISHTEHPSTGSSGSYTTTCTVNDTAGNTGSEDWTYSVTGGGTASGGASQSWTNNYAYDSKELSEQSALTTLLSAKNKITIKVAGTSHYVGVKNVGLTSVDIEIASTPISATLNVGDNKKFDLNSDGSYDLSVLLNGIVSGRANVTINSINEKIVSTSADGASPAASGNAAAPAVAVQSDESESGSNAGLWIGVVIVVLIVLIAVFFVKKNKKHR